MIRNTATVGFIVSHACPLKCDFCCHDRETIGNGRLRTGEIADTMLRFSSQPSVTRFAFTGGDPFLYFDNIVEAVRTARQGGVTQPFHMVTSGYWGGKQRTAELLGTLKDIGMDYLVLSYDREHARWVTPEQIMDICRTCRELSLPVELFASFWDQADSVEDLLPGIRDWADVKESIVLQAGRAKRTGKRSNHVLPDEEKYSCGGAGHYSMAVYPDGEVYPCCSGDFNASAKLSCGNIRVDEPQDILAAAYGKFHVRIVKEFGWGWLYEIVRKDFPDLLADLPSFQSVDTYCEICRHLNVKLADKLAPVYERIEIQYAQTMAEFAWKDRAGSRVPIRLARDEDRTAMSLEEFNAVIATNAQFRQNYLAGIVRI